MILLDNDDVVFAAKLDFISQVGGFKSVECEGQDKRWNGMVLCKRKERGIYRKNVGQDVRFV